MAAKDYYDPLHRDATPLPTGPPLSTSPPVDIQASHSITSSLYSQLDDAQHGYYQDHKPTNEFELETTYYGAAGPPDREDREDPFEDQNSFLSPSKVGRPPSPTKFHDDVESQMMAGPPETGDHKKHRDKRKTKRGWFKGKIAWVVYILSLVQVAVFIGEIIKNSMLTGSPIAIQPSFNPMIGPSPYILINMGGRYEPCMHNTRTLQDAEDITGEVFFPCPNTTTLESECSLSQLCGMGGVPNPVLPSSLDATPEPNQWWRFIIPIFLHYGLIHISFNLVLQILLGKDIEKEIGSFRFALVYFSSGIFGNVLGANYSAPNSVSTGASGAVFGILALNLLDLLYTWGARASPVKSLIFVILDIVVAFMLGLLPGIDNFAHIGGFLMGLVLGISIIHSPQALRERTGQDKPPYASVELAATTGETMSAVKTFLKQPVGFFKGRKPFWWVWWLLRAGTLVGVFVGFILLLNNFYVYRKECSWCKYLSCLPVRDWCDQGEFDFTTSES